MSKKSLYIPMEYFHQEFTKLKKYKEDFELVSTTYTKKITTKECNMFFNEDGKEDKKQLLLISAVRNDAAKFLAKNKNAPINESNTDFFNLLDIIRSNEVIKKIDLRSAYWIYAMKLGVVSEQTNLKFIQWYKNKVPDFAKNARLKALGALATTKRIDVYEEGRLVKTLPIETQPTKDLYMEICNGIDRLMKDLNYNVEGCKYYYWDCMFVDDEFADDAVEYLNKRGFDVKVEETKLEFLTIGGNAYILSLDDGKMYMTRSENKHLLQFEDDFEI